MLSENLKAVRRSKGLSQEELAERLHVVRQTVSKWEQGLSVPDADLLIALSETLETPVSDLLGAKIEETKPDEIKVLSEKLEAINRTLAERKEKKRRALHVSSLIAAALILLVLLLLFFLGSPYLDWNMNDPETAVAAAAFHAFEFVFVRLAPFALLAAALCAFLTRKKG